MSQRRPADVVEKSRRVYIAHPTKRDREEFITAARRSRSLFGSFGGAPADDEEYAEYLQRSKREDRACFLLRRIEDDALIGTINLGEIIRFDLQSANVGYNAFLPFTGQGYMTNGLDLVLRHAFRTLKLHRVEAGIQPHNERSIALVKRCNFEFEGLSRRLVKIGGRWRDHERWAILKEDWQAQRQTNR